MIRVFKCVEVSVERLKCAEVKNLSISCEWFYLFKFLSRFIIIIIFTIIIIVIIIIIIIIIITIITIIIY